MMATITDVWTAVINWLTSIFPLVTGFFYNAETKALTFVGVLAVIMAGVALILLVFNLIRSFLPMRG